MEERTQRGRRMYELGLRLGTLGTVAIGCAGGSLARALARAAGCGVALAGGLALFHDGQCAACAAWLGRHYALPVSLFLRQQGQGITLWTLDGQGRLFLPSRPGGPPPACTGEWDLLVGTEQAWAARRCAGVRRTGPVSAQGPAGLTLALERMGCDVVPPRPGIPLLRSDREGFTLTLEQAGASLPLPGTDALAAAAAWGLRGAQIPAASPASRLL